MPAWEGRLDSDEIESVAEYVFKQVSIECKIPKYPQVRCMLH